MPNCPCAPARATAPTSAGATATPPEPVPDIHTLRRQAEEATGTLSSVHDYLRLLSDCVCANTDNTAPIGTESLAVALRDQVEHLSLAEAQIGDLIHCAWTVSPGTTLGRDIETQSTAVYTLRHLLATLYDAFGQYTRSQQSITVNAYAATFSRMADRLDAVEKRLLDLVFASPLTHPTTAHPSSPSSPASSADLVNDHAVTCRTKRAPKKEAVCA